MHNIFTRVGPDIFLAGYQIPDKIRKKEKGFPPLFLIKNHEIMLLSVCLQGFLLLNIKNLNTGYPAG